MNNQKKQFFIALKLKDWITFLGVIILGFGWLLIDQIFLPEVYQRFIALFFLLLGLFYIQFIMNKPTEIIHYSNSLALISVSFIVIASVIMHVIIKQDFTYKSLLIWIVAGIMPYLSGFIYAITIKKN